MGHEIHDYAAGLAQARTIVARSSMTEKNKATIATFVRHLTVRGISKPRIIRYLYTLRTMAEKLKKDFEAATKTDIEEIVCGLEQSNYTAWTKKTYKAVLKRFYKWLMGNDENYPPEVAWIKTTLPRRQRPLPKADDLLTEEDVRKLINAADSPRDRALVASLWESGARIGELGTLGVSSVAFDRHGAIATLNGKTGWRQVRLIVSAGHLGTWLNLHPARENREAPLWPATTGRHAGACLRYAAIVRVLKALFWKANVRKKFNPHIFRHSRATFLANHLTEFQMNQYFGWVQGSDMPSTYVHLSGKNTDEALLKLYGIQTATEGNHAMQKPLICVRCDTINSPENDLCCKCGSPLGAKATVELDAKKNGAEAAPATVSEEPRAEAAPEPAIVKTIREPAA